ncbi:MAG: glycoside hydrolase family 127 protein [Chitinophagaceae bacterium]|nr:glycoside hydrolase family 127 protein [Chitinophagaceae bacterium]
MLQLKKILTVFCIILKCQAIHAQEFVVQGPWKVNFEDRKEFSKAEQNDSNWVALTELKWSDDRKTTANRVLWIRKTVVIPSTLKSEFEKTGLLTLSMGKILQSDNTYLNGKLIGATGSGDTYRNYLINKDDILWDKENRIAIRVSHWGTFRMSILPKFVSASPEHFFAYSSGLKNGDSKAPILTKNLIYQLSVINKSPRNVDGLAKADFYNFEGVKIHSAQKNVVFTIGNNAIEFPYTSASPFLKIVYSLSVPDYQYNHQWNGEFGYQNIVYKKITPLVVYKAEQKYYPADLDKLKMGGWLGERLRANTEKRLYKVDEDAILAGFINRPGSHSWIGEHIGKFLEAACNAYENSQDTALKIQIDRSAQQLIAAQRSDGYLGTYDMDSYWTSWDVWSHRYNLIGLLRYYELSGFEPALNASKKIGNLLMQTFGMEQGQREIVKAGGHVGMAATCILESMAELYRFSGEKKYLDYCFFIIKIFDSPGGPRIITTLDSVGRVDKVANAKAYEMLSNILGIIKLYRITDDEQFLKPVLAAWDDIVANRLYITGTASSFEHFQDNDILPAEKNSNMGEGCVTTTWVQYNYQLFCITGEMKYLNELERSVYNHLTGAENPQTGCVSYYTPLMGVKPFGCAITCCMSSVPRGIAMIPLFANGKIENKPTFLFYQPGTYTTNVANNATVTFTTLTNFPADGNISIKVDRGTTIPFAIEFRKPYWARKFSILVNGKKQLVSNTETVSIKRLWKTGDKVSISFVMPTIVLDGGKSYPNHIALQRGPQVLAFDENMNGFAADGVIVNSKDIQLRNAGSMVPKQWIGSPVLELSATMNGIPKGVVLVPYSDAGQTGGAITTWIKMKAIDEK